MSWTKNFRSIDQKFAWGFTGVFLSVVFFIFSIYTTFIYTKQATFEVQILDKGAAYNIRENLTDLDILYKGESIRSKSQMLSTIYGRIINTGTADITKNSYDPEAPIIFSVTSGKIITSSIIGASNSYLSSHGSIQINSNSGALISPVILEPEEHIDFKLLILHPENDPPTAYLTGKIAGIKNLEVTAPSTVTQTSFLSKTFSGDILSQALRAITYTIGSLILLVISFLIISGISEWRTRNQRKKFIKNFQLVTNRPLTSKEVAILENYQAHGEEFLMTLCDTLRDSNLLQDALSPESPVKEIPPSDYSHFPDVSPFSRVEYFQIANVKNFINEHQLASRSQNTISTDPQCLDFVNRFESFLLALVPKKFKREATTPSADEESTSDPSQAPDTPQ